jgi:hypothetical protein
MTRAIRLVSSSKRRLTLLGVVVVGLASALSAVAFFTTTGSGTGSANAGSLNPPTNVTVPGTSSGTVHVTWTASVTGPGFATPDGYYAERNDGSSWSPACGTSPTSLETGTSCDDTISVDGSYTYRVTAVYHSWTAMSTASNAVAVSVGATHFVLSAASTTPTAGAADNLTITAKTGANATAASYTGDHMLTFTGAGTIGGNDPTVTDKTGNPVDFGVAESITFTNGIATVSAPNNGVMRLYKAEIASIVVSDGTIDNGAGLSVTVAPATASTLVFSTQPGSAAAGSPFGTQPIVKSKDAYGNNSDVGLRASRNVTVSIDTGSGTLLGTATKDIGTADGDGTATFTNLEIDASGSKTLKASAAAGSPSLSDAISSPFTVSPGTADASQSTLTPTSAAITANGTATHVLTVTAKDAFGNLETTGGSTVTITKQSGTGTVGSVTDAGDGTYTATVTAPTATGSGVFVATLGGQPVKSGNAGQTQSTVTYVPGAADASQSTLTPTSASITANGTATQVLTVTVKDANGNLETTGGSTVTITKQSGTGTIGSVSDNHDGTYTATVTAPTATGSGVFAATLGGQPVKSGNAGQTQSTVTYVPGPADATQSTLTPTSASITANGTATQVLTVTAKDANGNLETTGGSTVTITKQSGTGTIGPVTDNGNGTYTATVTAPTATGSGVFVATLGAQPVKSGNAGQTQSTITYVPGAADASQSTLTPTSASITANGTATQLLTVRAKDAFGNSLTSGGSMVTITKQTGTGSIGSVSDNGDGTYTATVTAPTATGSGVFVATLGGQPVKSGTGSQTQSTVTYVPGPADASQSTLTPTSASITANGAATQVLTVTAKDAFGNSLTSGGSTVTITKQSGTGSIGSVTDNGNGTYTATVTAPTATGSGVFVATLGGQPVKSGNAGQTQSTVTYLPGPADASQSTLTPTSASITANGTATQVLTVTAKDANGNLETSGGSTVTITKQSGTGTIGSVTDNHDGTYTATVTAPTATGSGVFVATLNSAQVKSGTGSQTQSTITYAPGPADATQSTLTPTSASITANGAATQVLTVTAKDANGNLETSGGSTVTITRLSGSGSIGSVTDNANGTYTATVTAPTATGSAVFVATLGGQQVKSGTVSQTQSAITYTAGPATKLAFTTTAVSGQASTNTTLGPITVQLQDQFGNPVNAGAGGLSVTLSSNSTGTAKFAATSGGSAVTSVTIPNGSASVNFFYADTKAGTPTITGHNAGIPNDATQQETITAGAATALCIVTATSCSGSTVSGGHGFTFTSAVGLVDQFGNPATFASNVTITVAQTGNGGGVTTSGSMVIVAGQTQTAGTFTGTASGSSNKSATNTATSGPVFAAATVNQNT